MKKFAFLLTLILMLAFSISASADDNPYQSIMEEYKAYLYSGIVPTEDSMVNPLIAEYAGTDGAIQMLVYDLADINRDGVPEMIAAACYEDGSYKILDIFTVDSDKAVKLIEAGERSQLYLTEDGHILFTGSNGAANSIVLLYSIENTNLVVADGLLNDGDTYAEVTDDSWDMSKGTQISQNAYDEKLQELEDLKIDTFYTHQIQPDTVINMNCWHEYNGSEVSMVGIPHEITGTMLDDGTVDYMIPVTITAEKIGMEMEMTQNVYLNTNDFPARVLIQIDDTDHCLLFRLSDAGEISIEEAPLDSELGTFVGM